MRQAPQLPKGKMWLYKALPQVDNNAGDSPPELVPSTAGGLHSCHDEIPPESASLRSTARGRTVQHPLVHLAWSFAIIAALAAVGAATSRLQAQTQHADAAVAQRTAGAGVAAGEPAAPVLPSYAASGFLSALKLSPSTAQRLQPVAQPAGAEFRATVDIAATIADPGHPEPAEPVKSKADATKPTQVPSQPRGTQARGIEAKAAKAAIAKAVTDKTDKAKAAIAKAGTAKAAPAAAPVVVAPSTIVAGTPSPTAAAVAPTAAAPASTKAAAAPEWPKLLPQQGGGRQWSEADVNVARARCTQLLKQIDAVVIPEQSVRDGECGAAAPVRVVSVGRKPEVTLSPPALLTCDMAVALHDWVRKDLQPAARRMLHADIIKIEAMSDYSCRNAYGRARTRLSEHGRANALDIRGFITSKGEAAFVLEDWGRTTREIAWHQSQQRAIAHKSAAPPRAGGQGAPGSQGGQGSSGGEAAPAGAVAAAAAPAPVGGILTRTTIADGISRARSVLPGAAADAAQTPPAITFDMARLGGPKSSDVKSMDDKLVPLIARAGPLPIPTLASLPTDAVPAGRDARKALFLRHAHASACRLFGTVLGPEANNAHRNHLHVDLAERATGAFCE